MSQGSWEREQLGAGCRQQPQAGRNTACVNKCGFFGNETTLNMCTNCYRSYMSSQPTSGNQPSSAGVSEPPAEDNVSDGHGHCGVDNMGNQLIESADALAAEAGCSTGCEESDSSLLERALMVDDASSLGSARARFPRVQSASEGARDAEGHAPSHDLCTSGSKFDIPADSLIRTNASKRLDIDMHDMPVPTAPSTATLPAKAAAVAPTPPRAPSSASAKANRCQVCRKKVGLTAFKCRCSGMFCGSHRYSDMHSCSFDYKAAGREAIAKANPVVVADKVIRF